MKKQIDYGIQRHKLGDKSWYPNKQKFIILMKKELVLDLNTMDYRPTERDFYLLKTNQQRYLNPFRL